MNEETKYKLNANLLTPQEIEDLFQAGEVQVSDIPVSSAWHREKQNLRLPGRIEAIRKQEAEDAEAKLKKEEEKLANQEAELAKQRELVAKLNPVPVAQPVKTSEDIAKEQLEAKIANLPITAMSGQPLDTRPGGKVGTFTPEPGSTLGRGPAVGEVKKDPLL